MRGGAGAARQAQRVARRHVLKPPLHVVDLRGATTATATAGVCERARKAQRSA